jgi:hypothetical protein
MSSSKFSNAMLAESIDLDYFAIWLPSENLTFQGPFLNLSDRIPTFKIQDPVVNHWKFFTCIMFSPYIICYEEDEEYSKRREIVQFLNEKGVTILFESLTNGSLVFKQHLIPTHLLVDALLSVKIFYLRCSSYGTKGKLSYLKKDDLFWQLLQSGHISPSKAMDCPNVVFDFAVSMKLRNIILFQKPNMVALDKMWPMLHWLGEGYGGFVFNYSDEASLKIKIYSLLHHYLSSASKVEWKTPKTIGALRAKHSALYDLINRLKEFDSIGGFRVEIRISMNTDEGGFQKALDYVLSEKLLKLSHLEKYLYGVFGQLRSPTTFWKKEITPPEYFHFIETMMLLSEHLPNDFAGGGLVYGKNSQNLTSKQKELWNDLILSFGHCPPYLNARKLLLRDDTLHFWIAKWEGKVDLKYFQGLSPRKYQSMGKFISERMPHELIFATMNKLKEKEGSDKIIFETLEEPQQVSMLKSLNIRHPPKCPSKFCATYKSTGGCTKAFTTVEELISFLTKEVEKKKKKNWQEVYKSNFD